MPALPPNPSLKHLKHEAKELLKALKAGSSEAAARVSHSLPRLDGASSDAVLEGEVTLQEAQHVLAKEYGFRTWVELTEAAEPVFEQLAKLSDDELTELLRAADQKDVVVALVDAPTGPDTFRTRALMVMSKRVRLFILEEMDFTLPTPEDSTASRSRIAAAARQLGEQGRIDWPPGSGKRAPTRAEPEPPAELPSELSLLEKPLEDLSLEEIRRAIHALSDLARDRGITQWEQVAERAASDFVIEGLQMAVDGTEPDLVMDMLETRADTLVRDLVVRMRMVIEAAASISAGDHPRITRRKVNSLYSHDFRQAYRDVEGTVQQVRRRLLQKPASALSFDELNELMTDLATIVRRGQMSHTGGRETVQQVVDLVDDPFLSEAMRAIASGDDWRAFTKDLAERMEAVRREAELRYRLLCDGIPAIQQDGHGESLDRILDEGQRAVS
ncbi:FliG C-terminal domain-containing protein [Candidatus Latescibacterota bacterium]